MLRRPFAVSDIRPTTNPLPYTVARQESAYPYLPAVHFNLSTPGNRRDRQQPQPSKSNKPAPITKPAGQKSAEAQQQLEAEIARKLAEEGAFVGEIPREIEIIGITILGLGLLGLLTWSTVQSGGLAAPVTVPLAGEIIEDVSQTIITLSPELLALLQEVQAVAR